MFDNKNKGEKYKVQKKSCHIKLHIVDKDSKPSGALYSGTSITDPLGSYTGIPEDVYDKPVQDADDL